ncbi:hypothetical protein A2U01_0017970 [Trifolium medium]|uniref:Uncharacterized protein n=1 Tax=Trifolium medium TaxID=97028 RepID=A0A392ND51_9FABA|nr:hypothetical protein [Trifolium medium]
MLEHVREVKVVIFLEKASNPFAGKLNSYGSLRLRDLSLNGNLEIWQRRGVKVSLEIGCDVEGDEVGEPVE